MSERVTQDDVSKLYADIYNYMKEGVATANELGKSVKFELAECKNGSKVNNELLSLCALDASRRLGVMGENKDLGALVQELPDKKVEPHIITIPCPVLEDKNVKNDRYKNLDTANMVKIAAEVYQIANADKAGAKARVQQRALNLQSLAASINLKP